EGATITYWLAEPASTIQVTILDAEGAVVRELRDLPTSDGLHRVNWDLRYPGPESVAGASFWEGDSGGPLAAPGVYEVRLDVDGSAYRQFLQVQVDPRVSATEDDLRAQFELLLRVTDKLSKAHAAVNQITTVRMQLGAW